MKKEVLLKFRSRRAESLIDCGAAAAASLLSRAGHALYRRRRQLATVGVAVLAENLRDPADLVRQADAKLYEAKVAGRNRVCV